MSADSEPIGTDPRPEKVDEAHFRSFMTFGTGDGAPSASVVEHFKTYAFALSGLVPTDLQKQIADLDHDFSVGSDWLFLLDGLITKSAAEVWAAHRILNGGLALLTIFHHARALFETHALAHWMLGDFQARWQRVLKESLRERLKFEEDCKASLGAVTTDVTSAGHALLKDDSIKEPPSVRDQTAGNQVLLFDYAMFWKYSSSHVHPGHIGDAQIDRASERAGIEQILAGVIRHSAAVYRLLAEHFSVGGDELKELAAAAEEYAKYPFDLPAAD